jgi:MFS family permease
VKTASPQVPGGERAGLRDTATRYSRQAWLVVALLWVAAILNYIARFMITAMHGSIISAFPITEAQFGLLSSVMIWAYGGFSPVAGFLADRFKRSSVATLSLLGWSLTTWLTAYATSYEQLLVLRVIMGVSEACFLPAALALAADYHRSATRSLATGMIMTGIYLGLALSGLGGWLADATSWRHCFVLVGISGVIYAMLLLLVLREAPKENADETGADAAARLDFFDALRSLFSNGRYIITAVYFGLLAVLMCVLAVWLPTYMREHFHLDQGTAGFSATAYPNIAALVGLLFGGALADRWGRTNRRGPILVSAIGLAIAGPSLLLATQTNLLILAAVGLSAYGLTKVFADANYMPILCLIVDRRFRATSFGLLNALGAVTGGLSVYFAGVLKDRSIDISYVMLFCVVCLVSCSAIILCVKPRASSSEDQIDTPAQPKNLQEQQSGHE